MTRFLFILTVLLSAEPSFAQEAPRTEIDQAFSLPILTVFSATDGRCIRPPFTLRRNGTAPLTVAVVEDFPGGAGESIRASIWQAAMVAALHRLDPLSGVRITLDVAGAADGPSGGAAVCLAILSALDGRDFPADTAVTGAIMPDGTIGGVGGIAVKLRAAARGNIRRVFIPPYLRFETELNGNEVDLKRLAAELKIELVPVENIAQAYSALHGLEALPSGGPDLAMPALSDATEEALKARYAHHRQAALKIWEGVPAEERENLASEPSLKSVFIDAETEAAGAYRAGRLCLAAQTAWNWHVALTARQQLIAALRAQDPKTFDPHNAAAVAAKIREQLDKKVSEFPTTETLLSPDPQISESAAQLYADFVVLMGGLGPCDALQHNIEAELAKAKQPGLKPEEITTIRDEVFGSGQFQLLVAELVLQAARTWPTERRAVATTLPLRPVIADPAAIERLFFNAQSAARNTFRQEVVEPFSKELKITPSELFVHLQSIDMELAIHERAAASIDEAHRRAVASRKPDERRFALAVSAHLNAEALAAQAGLIARWNQLDPELVDGGFVYGRSDLLNYLLTAARTSALRAMEACRAKELVCLAAIEQFEEAESGRDHASADKVEVLTAYWKASLQAKALLLLCGPTNNVPMPAKSSTSTAKQPPPVATATPRATSTGGTSANPLQPFLPKSDPSDPFRLRSPRVGVSNNPLSGLPTKPKFFPWNRFHKSPSASNSSSESTVWGWLYVLVLVLFGVFGKSRSKKSP